MAKTEKSLSLLTQRLDTGIAPIARRIKGAHDRFTTDLIGVPGEDGTPSLAVRMAAWKAPDTDLWAVDRFTYVPSIRAVRQDVEAQPGLYFIDALALCAEFQAAELAGHENRQIVEIAGMDEPKAVHFREAAIAAGQLIEPDGTVRPCALGRVLTGGLLNAEALKIAATTEHRVLAKAEPQPALLTSRILVPSVVSGAPSSITAQSLTTRSQDDFRLSQQFDKVSAAGCKLIANLHARVRDDFCMREDPTETVLMGLIGVMSLGTWPVYSVISGGYWSSATRSFGVLKNKFVREAKRLPECRERALALDFARAVESAYWVECAAMEFENAADHGNPASWIELGRKHVRKSAEILGWSKVDTDRLEEDYMAGKLARRSALENINTFWNIAVDQSQSELSVGLVHMLKNRSDILKTGVVPS